jgi:hypothetical protein
VSAGVYANAAFTAANNAIDTWVRDAANSASSYANGAFGVANSASSYANGAFVQSNTATTNAATADQRAVTSGVYANAAYTLANTKFASTGGTISGDVNVTGNLTITGQTTYANTTTVLLGDNIITLNADIPIATAPTENAGLEVARGSSTNTSILWNETTDKWMFTNDGTNYSDLGSAASESYANSAYLAANTSDQRAVTSGTYANAAFVSANASINFIALGTANSASSYANSAYLTANASANFITIGTANSASVYANAAYLHANAAFAAANTGGASSSDTFARNQANAAFSQANTALGASLNVAVDSFTGDGSNTAFTLSITPFSKNFTTVTLDGISQHKSAYNVSSNILTFSAAPDTGVAIDVSTFYGGAQGSGQYQTRNYTGDGTTVNYTVSARTSANSVMVMENGVVQTPITDYTLTGTTLTFVIAPTTGTKVQIREMAYFSDVEFADSAYSTANSGSSYANSAYIQANSAYAQANTAISDFNPLVFLTSGM